MNISRSTRIAIGTICLVAIALTMGWFVGRYIPGQPLDPAPAIGNGLYTATGYETREIVDLEAGSTAKLRNMSQGQLYSARPDEVELMPSEIVAFYKESGQWEYNAPDIDLAVTDVKTIAATSIADLHPDYAGTYRPAYDDSELIVATVSITNASDSLITKWYQLPLDHVTLWSENLGYIDDSLGAGAVLDDAFVFINENYDRDNLLNIEPGESQTLMLPFKINKNNLIDQSAFDKLDPSDFCIQTVDFDTGTAYRLWL